MKATPSSDEVSTVSVEPIASVSDELTPAQEAPVARKTMNPDCRDGKHQACAGDGWDEVLDEPDDCICACHEKVFQ